MSFDDRNCSTLQGNGANPEMQSQPPAPASMCKTTNCGFYGNNNFDGMCSKCYKLKGSRTVAETQTPDSHSSTDLQTPSSSNNIALEASGGSESEKLEENTNATNILETTTLDKTPSESEPVGSDNVTAVTDATLGMTCEIAETNKPKKNKCSVCSKKVGLLGFPCRCGGLFCSSHRYSDTHDCKFDYKELGQDQIRKNNPVVVGKKITKI